MCIGAHAINHSARRFRQTGRMHADDATSTTSSNRRLVLICAAVIVLVTAAVAIGIGNHRSAADREWVAPKPSEARVIYDYFDVTVEPELQRSYRITLSEGSARLVIYSYDVVLFDETIELADDVWLRTLDAANEFHGAISTPRDGCADASAAELIVIRRKNARAFQVYVDGCTQGAVPNLASVVAEVSRVLDLDGALDAIEYDADPEATD